jgi:hypothetical protein
VEILEEGDVYFFYRPRVGGEQVRSPADVQRFLMVLHPWPRRLLRLLVAGRKRLPDIATHERTWWFVDDVAREPDELRWVLDRRTYQTRTRGERVQPPARPAGEGAYAIARHRDHTHLAYELALPREPGPVQRDLNIEPEASYIICVRNPSTPAAPGTSGPWMGPPDLPPELRERFRGRRFAPLDPPGFLDRRGTEIVLIGATHGAARELDLDVDTEVEQAARRSAFDDLRIARNGRPVQPLLTGEWR